MTSARIIYQQHAVPNGPVQFFATVMVLQHLATYSHWPAHQARVMAILKARQCNNHEGI